MASEARQYALLVWTTLIYWMGKGTGILVAETHSGTGAATRGRPEFIDVNFTDSRWRWAKTRAWNMACLAAVMNRIRVETWPITVQATRLVQPSCYDTVCGGLWCVYACVYYAVAWLDRMSEIGALLAAVVWRRRSTVACLNAAVAECLEYDDTQDDDQKRPSASDVPWHAYLTIAFPVVQFATAASAMSPFRNDVWHAITTTATAVASCAPVVAHGTAAALLVVSNNSMRSINYRIIRLLPTGQRRRRDHTNNGKGDLDWRQRTTIAQLARRHWSTTELVTRGVCAAYGVDLMTAVLLAAVRVTYVAISVFHRLTDDTDAGEDSRTNMSQAVIMQLIAWFGQFAYLSYTCDELASQVLKHIFYLIFSLI